MLAYKDTIRTKKQAVADARKHRKQDMLIQGTYSQGTGKEFKGCSVGCMYQPFKQTGENIHFVSERVDGIPQSVTALRDRIFEGLSYNGPLTKQSKDWHVDFTLSISVGADLSMVTSKFMLWILTDKTGILKHATPKVIAIIKRISDMYKLRIAGKNPSIEEWQKVRKEALTLRTDATAYADAAAYAAAAAAAAAADAAAYAAYATDAAAAAAADAAAAYAADAAAYAYATARKKYFVRMSVAFIKILKETKAV